MVSAIVYAPFPSFPQLSLSLNKLRDNKSERMREICTNKT